MNTPQPGDLRDILFGASATSADDVWAVGEQQSVEGGPFATLAEHFDGHTWTVTPTANPGSAGNHLFGVTAIAPDNVWAVGQQLIADGTDGALIEHWNGTDIVRIDNGKFAEYWLNADTLFFMQQIGIHEIPALA